MLMVVVVGFFITPVFGQEMSFYEDSFYEYSFNYPSDWQYQESVQFSEESVTQVVFFPKEFSILSLNESERSLLDLSLLDMGFEFQMDSPLIILEFGNLPPTLIPSLNDKNLKEYEIENIIAIAPNAKIINSDEEIKSWGRIITTEFVHDVDLGNGQKIRSHSEEKTHYFKNGEVYTISYLNVGKNYDVYYHGFETVIETLEIKGLKISDIETSIDANLDNNSSDGGGCLIATATYGSELTPQVQQLRELRDHKLLQTESGSTFMNSFNDFYYSFSPIIADYERENPVFKDAVKIVITPMIFSLSILNHLEMDSDQKVLGYGISLILLNVGMYVGIPIAGAYLVKLRTVRE
jgi:hypothetical protein